MRLPGAALVALEHDLDRLRLRRQRERREDSEEERADHRAYRCSSRISATSRPPVLLTT